jgi:hypothetical protein
MIKSHKARVAAKEEAAKEEAAKQAADDERSSRRKAAASKRRPVKTAAAADNKGVAATAEPAVPSPVAKKPVKRAVKSAPAPVAKSAPTKVVKKVAASKPSKSPFLTHQEAAALGMTDSLGDSSYEEEFETETKDEPADPVLVQQVTAAAELKLAKEATAAEDEWLGSDDEEEKEEPKPALVVATAAYGGVLKVTLTRSLPGAPTGRAGSALGADSWIVLQLGDTRVISDRFKSQQHAFTQELQVAISAAQQQNASSMGRLEVVVHDEDVGGDGEVGREVVDVAATLREGGSKALTTAAHRLTIDLAALWDVAGPGSDGHHGTIEVGCVWEPHTQ